MHVNGRRPRPAIIAMTVGLIAWMVSGPAIALQTYTATPLGTLGGGQSSGNGINSSGHVTGTSSLAGELISHAFLYANGTMRDLGTLGGSDSSGAAVNASGQVTGGARTASGLLHAFLYSAGAMTDLGSLGGNIYPSAGTGINDSGEVSGWSVRTDFQYAGPSAVVYSGGEIRDIASGSANGINASGQVAGTSGARLHPHRAFVYAGGVITIIGAPDGIESAGLAINASGEVAGLTTVRTANPYTSEYHAYRYSAGTTTDLGTLDGGFFSQGTSINSSGQVVGTSRVSDGSLHAFLHSAGVMHDLNALVVAGLDGALLTDATAINDAGQIVANSCPTGIGCTAYRLDPRASPAAVEFYNAALDHYFLTHLAQEIAVLDGGVTIKGWARTGQSFNIDLDAYAGTSSVCRYYIPPAQGDSHFYGRGRAECDSTERDHPSFINEDPQFFYVVLPTQGVCPAGTRSVYRVFSNRADANHRYLVDRSLRDQMVGNGWLAEGDGPDRVVMCASL